MFRFNKGRDIITLFHKANSPVSTRIATLLKQTSAASSETATEDQVGDHSAHNKIQRDEFDINITEEPPTSSQLETILDYAGTVGIPQIVKGAESKKEALEKFKQSTENFNRPVVVDWHNGKAIGGGNESAILTMLNALPKKN
ncbi:putative redox protein fmp46, mitochondrial [Rhypophila decipiens]|uniref:Redox protein fmp46, mitochondrial n=1 Tax=Rhypophila decipiens TaxID=261697 RepID=A0AAN7BCN0_9PEZI|nr:putative redox protein fmp46, mitochondrial [Rhypophila decipiens]